MRSSLLAAVLAVPCVFAAAPAPAETRPTPVVTVVGEAHATVQPDMAVVTAGVTSQGKTAREAVDANSRAMTAVLAALTDAGVAEADVQTTRLSLQPVHDPNRPPGGRIVGFQASNQVTVKVRDIGKVSDVVDRVVGAGANTISGIEFLVSEPGKALDQMRSDAMAEARRKADLYAQAAGATLGHAVAIEERGAPAPFLRAAPAAAMAATPIAPGEETLRFSVTVSYELRY